MGSIVATTYSCVPDITTFRDVFALHDGANYEFWGVSPRFGPKKITIKHHCNDSDFTNITINEDEQAIFSNETLSSYDQALKYTSRVDIINVLCSPVSYYDFIDGLTRRQVTVSDDTLSTICLHDCSYAHGPIIAKLTNCSPEIGGWLVGEFIRYDRCMAALFNIDGLSSTPTETDVVEYRIPRKPTVRGPVVRRLCTVHLS